MCCTFGDLTDVMWWRELDLPVRTVVGRDGRLTRETPEWLGTRRRVDGVRRDGGQDDVQRPRGDGRPAPRVRRPRRRAEGHAADGELLREGRQAARDRRDPPVVHHQRRARRRAAQGDAGPRRGDHLDPRPHEAPLRQLGRRPQRRLARSRGSGSSASRSRSGTPLDGDGEPDHDHPLMPSEDQLPVDPSTRGAARLHRGPAREARRLRRRPRRDGHVGDLLADAAHRGHVGRRRRPVLAGLPLRPGHPGARHHPHLAVLARRPRRLREPGRPVVARDDLRLHRRPRPQEDVEVQGQRRRPDRHPRQVRRRRRPLARRHRPPRCGLAVRRVADEGRAPARDEGAQRLEVRPRQRRRHRARRPARSARRSTAPCSAGSRSSSARPPRPSTPTTTRPRSRSPRSSSGSSATTTSSWSRSARTTPRAAPGPSRPARRSRSRCTSSSGCSRRSCPTPPRRSGRGGRTARSTTPPGRPPPTSAPPPPPQPLVLDAVAAALTGIRGAKSQAKAKMRAPLSRVVITGPAALVDGRPPGAGRPARGRHDRRRPRVRGGRVRHRAAGQRRARPDRGLDHRLTRAWSTHLPRADRRGIRSAARACRVTTRALGCA